MITSLLLVTLWHGFNSVFVMSQKGLVLLEILLASVIISLVAVLSFVCCLFGLILRGENSQN